MASRQPFARRIVIAFTLMTFVVSGLFSLSIVGIVYFIESHLVSEELHHELVSVLENDLQYGRAPRLDARTRLFSSALPEHPVPARYADLAEGFSEVIEDDGAYYAYQQQFQGQRYLLLQEQQGFEAREQVLFNVVLAGFLLTVAIAWGLGWVTARKVMEPVTRLARQVRHRDQLHALAPALAVEYPDDEVGHLAAAFDSTLGQLRQTLERERLFTSDVSHELRTPLMVISTSCELLEQAPLSLPQKNQVQRISRAAQQMNSLVQTFLLLARTRPQESTPQASLLSVAWEQAERWGTLMHDKGLAFEMTEEGADPQRYNHTFLSSVMSNLLRNALHYTEQGQVRLVLEAKGFRVEDSGYGIPPEQQERMFQPFVRGTEARGEGLGLGLSLVKRICEHEGWQVGVAELQPQGSCFRVQLHS
jgi:signal transduction histidine kinase